MLKVIIFYMYAWWFKKIENRKELIVRSILAGIFAIICWGYAIWLFVDKNIAEAGFTAMGFIVLVPAVLLTVRLIFDAKKLYFGKANKADENSTTSNKQVNQKADDENTELKQ